MTIEAKQVHLYEQLEDVPLDARLVIEDSDGMGATILAIGRMCHGAAAALRAAIEQAQEPVAWVNPSWLNPETRTWESESFAPKPIKGWIPLYTAPRQWQGLTDKELAEFSDLKLGAYDLCLEVEAKLREKNHA